MTSRATLLLTALALGACASGKEAVTPDHDPYFTLPFIAAKPQDAAPATDAAQTDAFAVQISIERADGSRLGAPQIAVHPGQVANVVVGPSMRAEAATGGRETQDGLRMEVCVQCAADGGATIGFRVVLAKTRESGAEMERVDVSGARWMEPGVIGMLARVTSPDGSGPLLVLARVTPIEVPAPPPGAVAEILGGAALARPMSGHTLHVRVSAVQVGRDFEPGTVLDETAAPDVMKAAGGRVLHDFEIYSCLDSRVRLAGLVEAGGTTRGLVAQGRDDGKLDISWTTTGEAHRATIRPNQGRRFVAVARVEGGGTAGVIVSVDSD